MQRRQILEVYQVEGIASGLADVQNRGPHLLPENVKLRRCFEEQVAIFKAATANERFSFRGKHYTIPPDGLEFRDEPVTALPLVPRPINAPVPIYQAVSSEETLKYAARERHIAVFWQLPRSRLGDSWRRYAELVDELHGVRLARGEDRMLVVNVHLADTYEQAMREARPGHDELRRAVEARSALGSGGADL